MSLPQTLKSRRIVYLQVQFKADVLMAQSNSKEYNLSHIRVSTFLRLFNFVTNDILNIGVMG